MDFYRWIMEVEKVSKLCPLFSGSSGNSIYIGHSGEGILIDAGKNAKQLQRALEDNNLSAETIKAIFITHEHSDHISGIRVFASRYGIKVYASEGTINAMIGMGVFNGKFPYYCIDENGIDLGNIFIRPFTTSHDSSQSVGYTVELSNGTKLAVCTDLGFISKSVYDAIIGCNIVVIESNHDIGMLQNGPYPYYLKRRILSEKGHLSNEACSKILPELVRNGATRFVLSHLSKENNIPELAYQTAVSLLSQHKMEVDRDFTIDIAPEYNGGTQTILF